jgi:hypothetical protein
MITVTVAQQIGQLNERFEQMERAKDFYSLAGLLVRSNGNLREAREVAARSRVSARVRGIISSGAAVEIFQRAIDPRSAASPNFTQKAAVAALTLDGSALADYKVVQAGFLSALANIGAYDRLLNTGMRKIPMSLATVGAFSSVTGYVVSEGSSKPVSSFTVTSTTTDSRKAMAEVAISAELARLTEDFDSSIGQHLRAACVKAVDEQFIAIATSGISALTSSGSTLSAVWDDLGTALHEVNTDASSRLFLIMTSKNAEALAVLLAEASSPSTMMTPRGGTIAGIEVLISDALAADTWVLVDASGFVGATDDIMMSTFKNTSAHRNTAPDSPPSASTIFQSNWQLNQISLVAERFFICERLRTDAVAHFTGAAYASGFSP